MYAGSFPNKADQFFFLYLLERIEKLNDSGWIRTNVTRLRNEYLKPLDYRAKIYICFIFTSNQM